MKNEYVKLIENAGFKEVKVIEETHLPAEMVLSNPTARALMKEFNLTKKSAQEIVNSVISIKISATKPQT
jgi:3,4-dihydroxy-2-butanone 4-phosphate synthase